MLEAALRAVPRVRRTDPGTSYEAASRSAALADDHQQLIYAAIVKHGAPIGATALQALTGLTQVQICRRLPELQKDGWIKVVGLAKTAAGRSERTWEPLF